MTEARPLARTEDLLTEAVDDELLVYDLNGDIAMRLNVTAALVWRSCDGERTVAELVTLVEAELGETVGDDAVLMALDNLSEHGLIASGYEERDGAAVALSRRRFFQRFGVSTGVALAAPVVYSLTVPAAAAAQSTGGSAGNGSSQFNDQQFNNQPSGSDQSYP